jgi:hypothetical protein
MNNPIHRSPEEAATCRLIEISSLPEDSDSAPAPPTPPTAPNTGGRLRKDGRLPVAENYTKCFKMWRRSSVQCVSGEQVCVMSKRMISLSQVVMLERPASPREQPLEQSQPTFKNKPKKHILAFFRNRNTCPKPCLANSAPTSPTRIIATAPQSKTVQLRSSCEFSRV